MTTQDASVAMRRCIGSKTFGIAAHEAPVGDFPAQPSQKDGLGRMCRPHWRAYTNALRKAAVARKAAEAGEVAPETAEAAPAAEPETPAPRRSRRAKATAEPEPEAEVAEAAAG